jgi:hypothetical protein
MQQAGLGNRQAEAERQSNLQLGQTTVDMRPAFSAWLFSAPPGAAHAKHESAAMKREQRSLLWLNWRSSRVS